MTIHEALETTAGELTTPVRYIFSTLEEANATLMDKIPNGDFPVCFVIAFNINDYERANGRVKSQAEINVMFLDKIPAATIDTPITKIETDVVAPMRTLTREFVNKLDKLDVIEDDGISSVNHQSVHEAVMDAHLYGNMGVFTIKFTEDLSTCE